MIMMAPEKMPEEPHPAIARPIINAVEFGAAPHNADPTSKMAMEKRKTFLGL